MCVLAHGIAAQTTSGGSAIEGRVVTEDGQPVAGATVTVMRLPNPDVGTLPPAVHGTGADQSGRFKLTGLAPAGYRLCAQMPWTERLNPCDWNTSFVEARLNVNETRRGVDIVMPRGYPLSVRFDDPDEVLEKNTGRGKSGNLTLTLERDRAPLLVIHPRKVDRKGREYHIAVPFDTDFRVRVIGTKFEIEDEQGRAVDARSSIPFRAAKAQAARPVVFKVKRLKP